MRKLIALSLITLILSACTPTSTIDNDFVVMLTSALPNPANRCTGFLIDDSHVITANHCTKSNLIRVVTVYGEESSFDTVKQWEENDIALLKTSTPLHVSKYATISTPNPLMIGHAIGMCPEFMGMTEREVLYKKETRILANPGPLPLDVIQWKSFSAICGGDSGGVILQGGEVVGLINATEMWFLFAIGESAYATSGQTINQLLQGELK